MDGVGTLAANRCAADSQALRVTGRSPLPNFATGPRPLVLALRHLMATAVLLLAGFQVSAQEISAFPETPRPVRRLDHATPVSLTDVAAASLSSADAGKTLIRRVSDSAAPGSPSSRSQTTVWVVLVGIVGAAAAVSYWSRRSGAPAHWKIPTNVLQVLGRTQVSANQSVTLLRLGERVLLVSSSGPSLQTLAVVTDPAEVATITSECLTRRTGHLASNLNPVDRRSSAPQGLNDAETGPVAGSIGGERVTRRRAGEQAHA